MTTIIIIWLFSYLGAVAALQSTNGADFSSQTFDYVVIGGGTAGLALAARLSDNPEVSVGVIEAGPYYENDPLINTPALTGQLQGNAKYDWMFKSVPQSHVNNRILPLPRGKALGGSSTINLMVFNRASEAEYEAWERLGNPGWNWKNLLPYMKSAKRFIGIDPFRVNHTGATSGDIYPTQGTKGPIAASFNKWYSDIVLPYRESMANLNVPINFDPDSGNPFGLYNSATAVNRTTGTRSYAANTYFAYNSRRQNFVVLTGAQATKVEFRSPMNGKSDEKLTATGVSFLYNSTTYTVRAKQEVILSAGTFQTPQLLELSGIGNATILRQNGITPLVDLPGVGENLQDHLFLSSSYELKQGITTLDILRNNASYAASAQAQYAATHDGILTSSISVLSFLNFDYLTSPTTLSTMIRKLNQEIAAGEITRLQQAQYEIQKDWLRKRVGHLEVVLNPGKSVEFHILWGLWRTYNTAVSQGILGLELPRRTRRMPHYQWYSNILSLAGTSGRETRSPPETTSDNAYVEYVKTSVRTIHHPIGERASQFDGPQDLTDRATLTGTAALAPRAIGGVVDTSLKVYGTSNVRVVDASIIPIHMSAHLSRTVYGIAERAAAIIVGDST